MLHVRCAIRLLDLHILDQSTFCISLTIRQRCFSAVWLSSWPQKFLSLAINSCASCNPDAETFWIRKQTRLDAQLSSLQSNQPYSRCNNYILDVKLFSVSTSIDFDLSTHNQLENLAIFHGRNIGAFFPWSYRYLRSKFSFPRFSTNLIKMVHLTYNRSYRDERSY